MNHIGEQMPMFGLLLSVLAVAGLAVRWRRRSAWLLAALWLGCAWLTLGATLYINRWPARAVRADLARRGGVAG